MTERQAIMSLTESNDLVLGDMIVMLDRRVGLFMGAKKARYQHLFTVLYVLCAGKLETIPMTWSNSAFYCIEIIRIRCEENKSDNAGV